MHGRLHPSLQPEIAFLTRHGVRERRLLEAEAAARSCGVDALTALLRTGVVSEAIYYRALAAELGLPFLEGDLALAPEARFPESIQAGVASAAGNGRRGFVLAPGGGMAAQLLRSPPRRPDRYAITTPTALRRAVLHVRAAEVADAAANRLRREAPEWCYLPGLSLPQALAVTAGLVALALATGIVPTVVTTAFAVLAGTVFLAMTAFRLTALFAGGPITPPPTPRQGERDLPVYTVVVALYREAPVVPRIVRALARLDYPAAKLDIKFVLEHDDPETRAALAAIPLPARFEIIVAPPGRPRTKPRALNVALPLAKGSLLVVFDAEDVPDPGQLRLAASMFSRLSERTACLQGRLVIDNTRDGWLPRLFTLEYAALFDVLGPALASWEMPYPLGGTSTHFRVRTLRRLHGWDAWNVTEDADLGIRLALQGYLVGDLPSATIEEAPAGLRAWLRQRSRWMKGYMQVCITHSRHPGEALARIGPVALFGAFTTTFGTVGAALGYPFFMAGALLAFASSETFSGPNLADNALPAIGLVVFAAGFAAMILPPAVGALRRGWWGLACAAPLMPLYFMLVSVAAWRGLIELVRDPAHWHKTEHGLAKTSRSGALTGDGRVPRRRPRADGRG